ncbi:adenylyltransferase [Burkholderia sp. HB1]|jgi:bifunctional enzyme CysN/CysC|nr:adenylyltransferase [Burkholderia sp. HB1]
MARNPRTNGLPQRTVERPGDIDAWLAEQSQLDQLRFITCGSVDDGKSTLIGRLLWDSRQLFDDQLAELVAESRMYGTQRDAIDFALLVDGLSAEREQGITIDVAYRFFATRRRKFIVADTPGHEQYTRNMATAASTAAVAILLVDARRGIQTQTRRHAFLASLFGIRHVVLAVNKMDLVGFDRATFDKIEEDFSRLARPLHFDEIVAIPVAALHGDNITQRSARTVWYTGPTLLGYLETVNATARPQADFALPVQWINRSTADFRGICGTVAAGAVRRGDELRVTSSGQCARVSDIVTFDGNLDEAQAGDAITVVVDREIDVSRGDVLTLASQPLEVTDQFRATVIWMQDQRGLTGRKYELKLASQWVGASITAIKHRINVNTFALESARDVGMNDIVVCNIATSKPVAFMPYENSTTLGGFLLVDNFTRNTVAAGIIHHSLRRSQNVHRQPLTITREDREQQNGHPGKVIWFTGLSGAGKSTIANALEVRLHALGKRTYILDGDNVRQGLNKDLGFEEADRVENIRRVAEVAKLMMDAGLIVLTAFISPFRQEREMARQLIGADRFVEVYVNASLTVCEERDPKGLYRKARNGLLPNMTGIDSPYEAPEHADVTIDTGNTSIEDCTDMLVQSLDC